MHSGDYSQPFFKHKYIELSINKHNMYISENAKKLQIDKLFENSAHKVFDEKITNIQSIFWYTHYTYFIK